MIAVVFYNIPEEVITLLLYIFFIMVTTQWNFYCLFLGFLILQITKKSCNETSVMNMWFVNENVRSVNEKRMPTLKRKHDDLRRTASAPGQKRSSHLKLSPEKQLKQRYLLIRFTALGYWNEERLIKSLGFLECVLHLFQKTINRYMS